MPDITMCRNTNCELKYKCYRYMAIPKKHMQSYSLFDVVCPPNERNMYSKIEQYDQVLSLTEITQLEIKCEPKKLQ